MNHVLNGSVALWEGDMTRLEVDAMVNAARPSLLGGGGIDRAIHLAAGPQLREFCARLGGCAHGDAKVSPGFGELRARMVIHAVAPNRDIHDSEEAESQALLARCYASCLELAHRNGARSIGLCCLGVGAYRFPNRLASCIALGTIRDWCESRHGGHGTGIGGSSIERIVFVTFNRHDTHVYSQMMFGSFFPVVD